MMRKIFVFPGQGSQALGMGQGIYDRYDIAKNIFGKVNHILNKNLTEIMFNGPSEELNLTQNTQPALMAVSVAILEVLKQYGKGEFNYVAGHSLGEYTALYAVGVLSLEDTTKLLDARGLAMQKACDENPGAMAACMGISKEDLHNIFLKLSRKGVCNIANDNSSNQIVISGEIDLIDEAIGHIKEIGKRAIKLKVNGAFHSPLMQEAEDIMAEKIEKCHFKIPQKPVIMNVTAASTTNAETIKENLKKQITSGVRWREIIEFAEQNELEIVEIGSGNALSNMAKKDGYPHEVKNISNADELEAFLSD
ncbi:acyl-carrier-protein S-malonyltransferase [Candidatus Phycorickettsia trachydisci]|uniref:Malonyl CoA-acyl carrier protein transacylase n=1 Tax=Candidatus Phycorickettsia trachydisci TaxID=2115978 RepID=A0A2P1P810_9RICK|nr:ACP S-malonyltransferase [Candidatus Phycorickettsia trachydisci]AVP87397.1 acyl-carrier-protein S-malonyltransferase [Candidatus Phycorickettsia trachydisci]